ncbi:MAG TPA: hypothetical protein VFN38_18425, partial [Gemmatimonadaceae bacterium]|nr:hypothetical protein [Gemmatimonadaceae bacterium]
MSGRGITKAATWRCALAALIALLFALLVLAAAAGMQRSSTAAAAGASDARYALANGCYALRSRQNGKLVAKDAEGRYAASAGSTGEAEAFRMKATALGSYLFYGRAGDFLAAGSPEITDLLPVGSKNRAASQATPNEAADWTVDTAAGAFQISLPYAGGKLLATSGDGQIVIADPSTAGDAALFAFEPSQGCATFPEVEVNATGTPSRGATPFGEVRGLIDAHIHGMAFEFLGGRAHCGRPWSPYGVTVALVDCPDHVTGAAPLETGVSGTARHDPAGWPTFKGWPTYNQLTHEQTYYKWLERSWRGGLRVWVNLLVDNHALCELYPLKKNSCNEMDSVRLQAKDLRALENYIDAQEGGPGKGWFRIVESPYEARRVINEGKLAVVMGIENSKLFDCGVYNGAATCDRATIDREMDEVYKLGVRDMELINKFDNGFGGVAGDSGNTGIVVNTGNFYETGKFWDMQTCQGPNEESDHEQMTLPGAARDVLVGDLLGKLLPGGTLPAYPAPPHCNTRGLSALGDHLVRDMIAKRMIVDPDHLDVISRKELLSIAEAARYSGAVSSHSWSTADAYPRIYKLGGFITPYAGSSVSFANQWKALMAVRDKHFLRAIGWGADMNGF